MTDIFFLVNGFFCSGRYEIKTSLFVSMRLLLTVGTLYVSFVSRGCLQEPTTARIPVLAGRLDLLIMG